MVRRLKIDVIKDILIETAPKGENDEETINGASKTYIMNNAGLSYVMLNPYLKFLKKKSLLKENKENGIFIATQKGLKYLEVYHEFQNVLGNGPYIFS